MWKLGDQGNNSLSSHLQCLLLFEWNILSLSDSSLLFKVKHILLSVKDADSSTYG